MKRQLNDQAAIEMAYFRFALIAPVIQGIFPNPTKTLEKWEEYYRIRGWMALCQGSVPMQGRPVC